MLLLPSIHFLGKVEIIVGLLLCHLIAVSVKVYLAIGYLIGLATIYLIQPHQRAHHRAIAARMFRHIAWAPGYASILFAISLQGTVPSIQHIVGKIFGFSQIIGIASDFIRTQQLTDNPLLVVIHVQYASNVSAPFIVGTVYAIHRPLFGLCVRGKGVGASIIFQSVVQIGQPAQIALIVLCIQVRHLLLHIL